MMTFWADLRARTLNYWLRNMQIKSSDFEDNALLNKFSAKRDGGRKSKILKAVS
jgi:hypothetical protein